MSSAEALGRAGRFAAGRLGATRGTRALRLRAGRSASLVSLLLIATTAVRATFVVAIAALPCLPLAAALGFAPLPLGDVGAVAAIVVLSTVCGTSAKRVFHRCFHASTLAATA